VISGSLAAWWPLPIKLLFTLLAGWICWMVKPEQKMEQPGPRMGAVLGLLSSLLA
jgi:hypothetical protein